MISLELEIFNELSNKIINKTLDIQHNAKILAKIDILNSFAGNSIDNGYNKPKIVSESKLELIASRHPVVEQLLPLGEIFIPNDIILNIDNQQIGIITGPNMSGKSTYLRQIGMIVIMSHIGSFVPAKVAKIGIIDKLFTRVGASDNLSGGESTFMVEMNETANILNNATKNSLVLLDEIGRGTSTYDGLSIAWSVTEYLHNNKINPLTLFATHYHELVELADTLKRAFNLTIDVIEDGDKITFLRKIISGGASRSYGIQVAEMAGLPRTVILRSQEILSQLLKGKKTKTSNKIINDKVINKDNLLIKELNKINVNDITPMDALKKINEMKKKYNA